MSAQNSLGNSLNDKPALPVHVLCEHALLGGKKKKQRAIRPLTAAVAEETLDGWTYWDPNPPCMKPREIYRVLDFNTMTPAGLNSSVKIDGDYYKYFSYVIYTGPLRVTVKDLTSIFHHALLKPETFFCSLEPCWWCGWINIGVAAVKGFFTLNIEMISFF